MSDLKVLRISATDEEGSRFNGQDLHRRMVGRG